MRKIFTTVSCMIALTSASAFAADPSSNALAAGSEQGGSPAGNVPQSALYFGLGGNFDLARFGSQHVYAVGTGYAHDEHGALLASGWASGPTDINMNSEARIAPVGQIGFFDHFAGGDWVWGAKLSYSYLDSRSTTPNVLIPQSGTYFTRAGTTSAFGGAAYVGSYQTGIDHQFILTPYIGRAFENGFVYLGAGPSLAHTKTNINGLIGFADFTGTPTDESGPPTNFAASQWLIGIAATLGVTYFFAPSWVLDIGYTYAQTRAQTSYYSGSFSTANGRLTQNGALIGNSSGEVNNQALTATINWVFNDKR